MSIGSEPMQLIPALVLKSSILRRTQHPVEFTESWSPDSGWSRSLTDKPSLKSGTKFSGWRWVVPEVYGNTGKAIYLDADQVVLADIAELWGMLDSGMMFGAVCNVDPAGLWGKTTLAKSRKRYKNKVQTSVMVMNCRQCEWDTEKLFMDVHVGRLQYRDLMQADFLPRDRIQEISPRWNDFGIVLPETRLVHYSHVASQPYRNPDHPTARVLENELRYAIESGSVSRDLLSEEADKRHIHRRWAEL